MSNDDIPTIEGKPMHTASQIMADPAAASGSKPGVEYYRPKDILELIASIPSRTSNPALAQMFMLDALEKYSADASVLDVAAFDAQGMGAVVSGADWKEVGFQINSIIREHIDYVNGLADTPDIPTGPLKLAANEGEAMEVTGTQTELDAFIEALKAHDWSTGDLSPELLDQAARLDPTGEIRGRFDTRTSLH